MSSQQKNLLSYLKGRLEFPIRAFCGFFISCLVLEIFSLKELNCPPSWIIEVVHVTSQVGSRKVFILTGRTQNSFLVAMTNFELNKDVSNNF